MLQMLQDAHYQKSKSEPSNQVAFAKKKKKANLKIGIEKAKGCKKRPQIETNLKVVKVKGVREREREMKNPILLVRRSVKERERGERERTTWKEVAFVVGDGLSHKLLIASGSCIRSRIVSEKKTSSPPPKKKNTN